MMKRILLTGATGFVGRNLYPSLAQAGFDVRCASRNPQRADRQFPGRDWVHLDVEQGGSFEPALMGIDTVVYLVHSIGKADYAATEQRAAHALARWAERSGVRHIVYLGGVEPVGEPSKHLQSRLETGRILREGPVATVELRAGMIIGAGSASWQVCYDLATRLPAMVLPRWMRTRSEPVAIEDVVAALTYAAGLEPTESAIFDLPGPEIVSAREILERIAGLRGRKPVMIHVPLLSPRLSSYWLRLVTRANYQIARELVEGLTSDLIASYPTLWEQMRGHVRMPFDRAVRSALAS